MKPQDLLAMYESIATITSKMVSAANARDLDTLESLREQCGAQLSAAAGGVSALEGAQRLRKIELLKQIMANDRAVREITEPWHAKLEQLARAAA
ncbi:flagellar protein FliT [Massilia sp. CFBP 13647]|nr:flagellar protein FliT [Massilia sp. CFBP 13647]MBD8673651.1 flagellar protein FliT [Massilia sp. CFBP 13721]